MSILDRLNGPAPEAWRPKPGDTLVGKVVQLDTRTGDFEPYPIVTVAAEDGTERAWHAFHTVGRNELARQRPMIGDRLGVKYLGKSPKGYEAYRVLVEHATPTTAAGVDWTKIATQANDGAEADTADTAGADGWWPADDAPAVAPATSGEPPF